VQYTYDNLYRLTSINYGNGTTTTYTYDANGNRLQQVNVSPVVNFVFTGTGNWSDAANWQNGQKPPTTLPSGYTIVINPAGSGECVLDVNQTISTGASITVATGKKLRVPGNLKLQKP
jgi:YD repeat-containing protein